MINLSTPEQIFTNCRDAVPALRAEQLSARYKRLSALRDWIKENRSRIHSAVFADLKKPSMEADATEIFHVLNEIKVALRSLTNWAAPRRVDSPWFLAGTQSWLYCEPRGVCLIISPWNYPFGLAAGPLVSALAAGNSVILKPSEITPSVSALIREMCEEIFDPSIVSVCEGGVEVSRTLLALPFDHIFFTGSPAVGKLVMKAAAQHLTSVTLELGGKSPAIVSATANVEDAAKRIAVGKFLNNGQTCIAPDYLLVDEKIADTFIQTLIEKTTRLYASQGSFKTSPDYGRIVNEAHFNRITDLLDDATGRGAKLVWSGDKDRSTRYMHPVLLTQVSFESRIMKEEIFGPVLPIIPYRNYHEAIAVVNDRPKPLALYIFSNADEFNEKTLKGISAGTVCINDCGIQFLHHKLPFGGISNSGIGKSHGHYGFQAFSNEKPVLKQKNGLTAVQLFYPPFTRRTKHLMDWFLKLF